MDCRPIYPLASAIYKDVRYHYGERETGETFCPHKALLHTAVETCRQLLASAHLSLSEVLNAAGFHIYACFKKSSRTFLYGSRVMGVLTSERFTRRGL